MYIGFVLEDGKSYNAVRIEELERRFEADAINGIDDIKKYLSELFGQIRDDKEGFYVVYGRTMQFFRNVDKFIDRFEWQVKKVCEQR